MGELSEERKNSVATEENKGLDSRTERGGEGEPRSDGGVGMALVKKSSVRVGWLKERMEHLRAEEGQGQRWKSGSQPRGAMLKPRDRVSPRETKYPVLRN